VLYWATGTDRSIADFNHETTYGSRVYTTTKGGWYTNSPKTRDRIEQLIDWGVDPTKLCYDDSKCLDDAEVKSVYERIKDEKCPKPYKAEIRELKTHLGAAESYLQATKSGLEVTKSELESLKKRNLSLEERLAALEKSKESERK
jgi:polyhydroxyalkanoate synthesis regulator phasin